LLTLYAIILVD